MKSSFKLRITKKDIENCESFNSNTSCLIATALKRKGFGDILVGGSYCPIRTDKGVFEYKNPVLAKSLANDDLYPHAFLNKTFEFVPLTLKL